MRVLSVLLILTVLAVAAAAGFVYSGVYNVAASRPHTAAGRWLLNELQRRSVQVRADRVVVPSDFREPARIEAGAAPYGEMCVVCHGAPGVERGEIGKGITPRPPDLARAAPQWSDAELFWIVKHGIKLAGMPAFGETHTDDALWPIVAFVRRLPEMSAEEYRRFARDAGDSADVRGGNPDRTAATRHDKNSR
jgi:mono/diheme cytochrome c family protein